MKNRLLFLAALILFLFLIGLYWLAIGGGLIGVLALGLCCSHVRLARAIRRRTGLFATIVLTGAFALAILTRVFIMEIYTIPSGSMEKSLLPGDRIVMSKLTYGPKMPRSPFEIPWVNLLVYMNKEARAAVDSTWWGYKRARGYTRVRHQDVVVFDPPHDSDHHYIKRCVGLPGDSLAMTEAAVYINGQKQQPVPGLQQAYKVVKDTAVVSGKKPSAKEKILTTKEYRALTPELQQELELKDFPITVYNSSQKDSISWSTNRWGPLIIPQKGMRIALTKDNYIWYQKIMQQYEQVQLEKKDGNFLIDGKKVTHFTFAHNYYLMLGDNRHDSADSRYWGLVAEENILGKAVLVLFSHYQKTMRWKRFLHRIN